jgi:hypothetical protein
MSERIQTIKAFHERRNFGKRDNLLTAQQKVAADYRSLTSDECGALVRFAVDNSNEDILSHLACLQPGSLSGLSLELAQQGLLYPSVIFCGADEQATALLVEQLDIGEADNVNLSLLALAWADNPVVLQAFQKWRSNPPSWCESLHIPPHEYADSAGWELTADGQRRGLILNQCHPLVPPDHRDAVPGVVQVNGPSNSSCGWCSRRMTALLDFDLTNELLAFLGIEGSRLRIETCDVCTCYRMVFTQVDWAGGASWHAANTRPDYLPDDAGDWGFPKEAALVLGSKQRPITESADRNMPISFSQVGGHPSWEQDAEYPRCPSCQRRMVFIAQLSNQDYDHLAEGIYYAFLCRDCRVAATHYQQT